MELLAWITAISTFILACGVVFAAIQAYASRNAVKAQVLMKLMEEWRDPEIYRSVTYVHRLREQWRKQPPEEWPHLAERWVREHADRDLCSDDIRERDLWNEWQTRRTAAQFLAKMGALIHAGYLSADEFFRVVPEAARLLVVLWPIEKEIERFYTQSQTHHEWDRAFPKWEFAYLWDAYWPWLKAHAGEYELRPFDFKVMAK